MAYSGPDQVSTALAVLDANTGRVLNQFEGGRSSVLMLATNPVEERVVGRGLDDGLVAPARAL